MISFARDLALGKVIDHRWFFYNLDTHITSPPFQPLKMGVYTGNGYLKLSYFLLDTRASSTPKYQNQMDIDLGQLKDRSNGSNLFDDFASVVEKVGLETKQSHSEEILSLIVKIERIVKGFTELGRISPTPIALLLNARKKILTVLNYWMILFKYHGSDLVIQKMLLLDLQAIHSFFVTNAPIHKTELDQLFTSTTISPIVIPIPKHQIRQSDGQFVSKNEAAERALADVLENQVLTKSYENPKTQMRLRSPADIVEEGENTLYTWTARIWLDSTDASIANHFMYNLSWALTLIENVHIEITGAGVGSLWQRWKIRMKGWFAKEEVVQIAKKATDAALAYSMDRFIEPVEKSKIERSKIAAEINNMLTKEQAREMNRLTLEEKREDVKAKKLANLEKQIDLHAKLSALVTTALTEVDSDYRIMMNDLLAISKTKGQIQVGDFKLIEESGSKSNIDDPPPAP